MKLLVQKLILFEETSFPNELSFKADINSVFFDSNFESGNLISVYKVITRLIIFKPINISKWKCLQQINEKEYNMILNMDTLNDAYCQWFLFKVANVKRN